MDSIVKKYKEFVKTGKLKQLAEKEKDYLRYALQKYSMEGNHILFDLLQVHGTDDRVDVFLTKALNPLVRKGRVKIL